VNSPPPSDVTELVREYDKRWSSLDFVGLAELWETRAPTPVYLGDEYAAPLIGIDELDRHWARVASRIKAASMSSTLHSFDVIDDDVARAVLLSRWRLTGTESDFVHEGASWITWLLIRRDGRYRIVHHMESQVHLTDSEGQ
jgi:hypothetical protein